MPWMQFSLPVLIMFCQVHVRSHSKHQLGQCDNICYDLQGSHSSKLQCGFSTHKLRTRALLKHQLTVQPLEQLSSDFPSVLQVFPCQICLPYFFFPLGYHYLLWGPSTTAASGLVCMYSFLSSVQETSIFGSL